MKHEASIEEIRAEVDQINFVLLGLLNRRLELIERIAKLKVDSAQDFYAPDRESGMLARLDELNAGPLNYGEIEEIFGVIFHVSLQHMRRGAL